MFHLLHFRFFLHPLEWSNFNLRLRWNLTLKSKKRRKKNVNKRKEKKFRARGRVMNEDADRRRGFMNETQPVADRVVPEQAVSSLGGGGSMEEDGATDQHLRPERGDQYPPWGSSIHAGGYRLRGWRRSQPFTHSPPHRWWHWRPPGHAAAWEELPRSTSPPRSLLFGVRLTGSGKIRFFSTPPCTDSTAFRHSL